MVDPKLLAACTAIDEWCHTNDIKYDLVCDESDLQGIMLFKRDRNRLVGLLEHIETLVNNNGLHVELRKVRGGNIIALSLSAISESEINKILAEAGEEEVAMSFRERIYAAFEKTPEVVLEKEEESPDFLATAKKIAESQRKSATAGMNRSNQSTRQRQAYSSDTTHGGVEHKASPRAVASPTNDEEPQKAQSAKGSNPGASRGVSKGTEMRYEHKVARAFGLPIEHEADKFDIALNETLQGVATQTGAQPNELFNQFARALQVLGQQMGIGPLQDQLKQQGIKWKKSDDGLAIILYIENAATNAPQPIARITAETLQQPRDFEDQLTNMLDFAKGEAPGSLRQKQQEMKDQEGAIRDIAQAISPEDQESEVAKQMNQAQPAAQPAAQPTAGVEAATQAAAPKQQPVLSAGKIRKRSGII